MPAENNGAHHAIRYLCEMAPDPLNTLADAFFRKQAWQPFPFQREAWAACAAGKSGILNAPTGSGKTYALMIPLLAAAMENRQRGVKAIWITPIRALGKEIELAAMRIRDTPGVTFTIGVRSGDTSTAERARLAKTPPDLLITTPESLQILLSGKQHEDYFRQLRYIIVDEWHELMGSKRGVQMELACSRLRAFIPNLRIWGVSATIANMEESLQVLMGPNARTDQTIIIRAELKKSIEVVSILPDAPETLPWAGHLGIRILDKVIPIIRESKTTLIFTNTRSFAEIWYQQLLDKAPWLAGQIAMHHGSISQELRHWVEQELHAGNLKAVVCTSSLDLGVDFRPVETVIQVGSPKGIARFLQRAGRSGHQPGAVSRIWFLPTHSLELVEAAALRDGVNGQVVEERV
ncbi:MAG: DEAD/DEAH box helicase, partial [Bacteroidota bacterium]